MNTLRVSSRAVALVAAVALLAGSAVAVSTVTATPAHAKSSKLAKPKVKKVKNKTYYVGQIVTVKGKRMKNLNKVRLGAKTARIVKRTSKYVKINLPKVTNGTKAYWYKLAFYYPKKKSAWNKSFYYVGSQRIRVAVKKSASKPEPKPTPKPTPKPVTPPSTNNGGGNNNGNNGDDSTHSDYAAYYKSDAYANDGTDLSVKNFYSIDPGISTTYPTSSSIPCTPVAGAATTVNGKTSAQSVWDETCVNIRTFAIKFNAIRSANKLPAIPMDHFIPGNRITNPNTQGTTKDSLAAIKWAKTLAVDSPNVSDVHSNQLVNSAGAGNEVIGTLLGGPFAATAWSSIAHRNIIFHGKAGVASTSDSGEAYKWWSKAAAIARIAQQYAGDQEAIDYYSQNTKEYCIYYTAAAVADNKDDTSSIAFYGVCPTSGVTPDPGN